MPALTMREIDSMTTGPEASAMAATAHRVIANQDSPEDLEHVFGMAFELLGQDEPQSFLHIGGQVIHSGQTSPRGGTGLELLEAPDGRSCSLRLESCDYVSFDLDLDSDAAPQEFEDSTLDLPLGSNVYTAYTDPGYKRRAFHDALDDRERILVVGDLGIQSYIVASLNAYSVIPGESDQGQAARVKGHVLGAIIDKQLGLDSDYVGLKTALATG